MLDKDLLALLGKSKRYILGAVVHMIIGLLANIGIAAAICWAVELAVNYSASFVIFIPPFAVAAVCVGIRYFASLLAGDLKDKLGRNAKRELREKIYNKVVRLGVRSTDDMSMAGLTQVSMEGVEQLDLYYSTYIPQFFYAMISPFILSALSGARRSY